MSKISELFGVPVDQPNANWKKIVADQGCPFLGKRCYKVRKSNSKISIGTCSVLYGKDPQPIVICPARLTSRRQIFADCLHLLTTHTPGNELHIVSEVSIPGGSIDFCLVSTNGGKVKDFVGIELQTLDTTGTVWPERQRLLSSFWIDAPLRAADKKKKYGMNWKMTAKTILVQMHHKIQTFEHVNKKLVLIVQDPLLAYMAKEFNFKHLSNPALAGDAMHIHSYAFELDHQSGHKLKLKSRMSTDGEGMAICLGLQAEARVELAQILSALQARVSEKTLYVPI